MAYREQHLIEEEIAGGTRLEVLISALNQNVTTIAHRMRLASDAVVVNQCNEDAYSMYQYGPYHIRCVHANERGVGRSRNMAVAHAHAELVLFADEDIVYHEGYADRVTEAFDRYPYADLLLFNVQQAEGRKTYHITSFGRVTWRNYGRYPTYAIAARLGVLKEHDLKFSHLFGGGAPYMNGEDSLFLHDCLQKGCKIYHVPELIGEETPGPSTWFNGYTEKFFFDRGVLYHHLYGRMAYPLGVRFVMKNKEEMCKEVSARDALNELKKGIRHAALPDFDGSHDRVDDARAG